jgi:hypothetical protein
MIRSSSSTFTSMRRARNFHLHNWTSRSRKLGVSERPSTSLRKRFGCLLVESLPRPVVRPSGFQLAAR